MRLTKGAKILNQNFTSATLSSPRAVAVFGNYENYIATSLYRQATRFCAALERPDDHLAVGRPLIRLVARAISVFQGWAR